jgi:hypothetical protein
MFLTNKKTAFITILAMFMFGSFFVHSASSITMLRELKFLNISTPASKLVYQVGDTLDISGLTVTGTYVYPGEDGETPAGDFPVEITTDRITGFNSSAPITGQTLTITVDGISTTYTIDVVVKPVLKFLNITTPATKLTYYVGETLDISGLTVTGTYVIPTDDGEIPAEKNWFQLPQLIF